MSAMVRIERVWMHSFPSADRRWFGYPIESLPSGLRPDFIGVQADLNGSEPAKAWPS